MQDAVLDPVARIAPTIGHQLAEAIPLGLQGHQGLMLFLPARSRMLGLFGGQAELLLHMPHDLPEIALDGAPVRSSRLSAQRRWIRPEMIFHSPEI